MRLDQIIKQYRQDNKLSQREFARRCDLSNSLISIIEMGKNPQTGKPMSQDMETYKKLADGMGISLQRLFEILGDDAAVTVVPNNKKKPSFKRILMEELGMPAKIVGVQPDHYSSPINMGRTNRTGVTYGISEPKVIAVKADPELNSMIKLWKVSTPEARKLALDVLKVTSDKKKD